MSNPTPNQENDPKPAIDGNFEVAPIEQITRGEIDIQISTARANPRSLAQFMKRAEAMVCIDQETAESCFYRLERYDKKSKEMKIIEGESIRMAEIVAANYGNLRSAVHVIGHTPMRVTVRAVCHDLETNNLIAVEKQAKTTYSNGDPYSEDLAIVTTNALVSKALRDAIFRVVPRALLKPLKEKAKLVAFGNGQAFIDRKRRALKWATETRKVPVERVYAALGIKGEEDMTVEHLERLTGLKNAIMEGEQSVDDCFPALEGETKPQENPEKAAQAAATAAAEAAKNTATTTTATTTATPTAENPMKQAVQEQAKKTKAKTEPEKTPANVVQMLTEPKPVEKTTPIAPAAETTAPKTESEEQELSAMGLAPEQTKPSGLSPEQQKIADAFKAADISFEQFIKVAAGQWGFPPLNDPRCPKSWDQIEARIATLFAKSIAGVVAAVKGKIKK